MTTTQSPALDPVALRQDFPALHQEVHGHPLAYLDNAATAQKPAAVLEALDRFYRQDYSNVHRGIHELSRRATERYEGARERIADWIGAGDASEVIWTRGTTEAINLVASAWGSVNVGEGDEIILSDMEHHSNLVPWQLLAQRAGARLRYLEIGEDGRLELDALDELLNDRTRMVALGHVSNALGTVNPVREIGERVRAAGARFLVDGAQGAPHGPVDVEELGCDFYAFSGHKLGGPSGIGVLWGRRELLEAMPPYQGGGEMIHTVTREGSTWARLPHKFEAGTPNISGAVGMHAAADYLDGIGREAILRHEQELAAYAMAQLEAIPGVEVQGPREPEARAGVISFVMATAHPHDVATILDSQGVAVRAGHHCCQLVMKHYGVSSTTRASFYLYNTRDEVDRLVEGLGQVRSIFG